ncbi:MAG: DUF2304 domain-containing protein [Bacteroidales bacterium]|nr:DUF2304 domain-containing protein [Bacteroidales bacterium]
METLTNLFKQKKNSIINNTVLFVMSYLMVFYVVQISTFLSAFTHGVPMVLYTHEIDFSHVNSAASGDVWTSADNVIAIFGMAIIAVIILSITAVLLLTRWQTDKLQIKRFLFWIFICSFVRLSSNFIVGHISHLWNINLVTDFMGITYPGNLGKTIFIIVLILLTAAGFYWSSSLIKYILNPYAGRLKDSVKTDILVPAIIGIVIVNLFFIPFKPAFTWMEVLAAVMLLGGMIGIMFPVVLKRYRFVEESEESELIDDERINQPLLLIVLGVMIVVKVIFDGGLFCDVSPYRNYFLENVILLSLGLIIIGFLIYLYISYKKKEKKRAKLEDSFLDDIESVDSTISDEQWGQKKYDMSKYKDWDKD